jgi:RNA polymerase subunit RPABC4/transcription elongation factor Spt4
MAKDKKKSIGIKTARYFTKTCSKCKFEYPNWFTNCPKCGMAWDEDETEPVSIKGEIPKKTIKIVVKITEEDFDESIEYVKLIFSADHGNNWYQMNMENKKEYFIAEITEVPIGSLVIYYIEVLLQNKERVIENNEGKYYHYKVGTPIEHDSETKEEDYSKKDISMEKPFPSDYNVPLTQSNEYGKPNASEKINHFEPKVKQPVKFVSFDKPQKINKPIQTPKYYQPEDNLTIFGKPQTEIDPDLKACPYCYSKIKREWSTCPICGKDV